MATMPASAVPMAPACLVSSLSLGFVTVTVLSQCGLMPVFRMASLFSGMFIMLRLGMLTLVQTLGVGRLLAGPRRQHQAKYG